MANDALNDGAEQFGSVKTGLFETSYDSKELTRITIDYKQLSTSEDCLTRDAVQSIDLWLTGTAYGRYIRTRQRRHRYMEPTKFNECIIKCRQLTKQLLRYIDIFDTVVTYYELDHALAWDNLSRTHQRHIAEEIAADTGNTMLIDKLDSESIDELFDID